MKRNLAGWGLVFSLLMMGPVVRGEEPQNLLKNPGFEEIKPLLIPEPKYKDALPGVDEMPKGWMINYASYPGKLTVIYDAITSHGGSKYIRIEQTKKLEVGFATALNLPYLKVEMKSPPLFI